MCCNSQNINNLHKNFTNFYFSHIPNINLNKKKTLFFYDYSYHNLLYEKKKRKILVCRYETMVVWTLHVIETIRKLSFIPIRRWLIIEEEVYRNFKRRNFFIFSNYESLNHIFMNVATIYRYLHLTDKFFSDLKRL